MICSSYNQNKYYVYLACCANGTLYVGYTKNVEARIIAHNAGKGGRYTRFNRPLSLIATWEFNNQVDAIRMERALKRLPRERKLVLAEEASCLRWKID
jgi:putative endonuclease